MITTEQKIALKSSIQGNSALWNAAGKYFAFMFSSSFEIKIISSLQKITDYLPNRPDKFEKCQEQYE